MSVRKGLHLFNDVSFIDEKDFQDDVGQFLCMRHTLINNSLFPVKIQSVAFKGHNDLMLEENLQSKYAYGLTIEKSIEGFHRWLVDKPPKNCENFRIEKYEQLYINSAFKITGKDVELPSSVKIKYKFLFLTMSKTIHF